MGIGVGEVVDGAYFLAKMSGWVAEIAIWACCEALLGDCVSEKVQWAHGEADRLVAEELFA